MVKKAKKKAAPKPKKKKKVAKPKPTPMTTQQYLETLDALGLTVAGKQTAKALGLGLRHCQRIAAGDTPVPPPVKILLGMYLKHGIAE